MAAAATASAAPPAPDEPSKLVVRAATQEGLEVQRQRLDSRQEQQEHPPQSQSGSRFGQLSHSRFFARHNPHPHRCTHIRGLLGLLIPVVVDEHECHDPESHRGAMPVNAININSQRHPLDTINGLQYFTNLRNFSFREKAVPRLGLVPITENWREQLRSLTEQTFLPLAGAPHPEQRLMREATCPEPRSPAKQPATSRPMYSQQTGRLLPPPSRAMSRKPPSRRGVTPQSSLAHFEHISASPDLEAAVFNMLCQILQTEDYNAVQAWLVSASDKEKAIAMDLIRTAVSHRDAYYEVAPTGHVLEQPSRSPVNIREDLRLPPIEERGGEQPRVDRLVIEDNDEQQQQQQQQQQHHHHHHQQQQQQAKKKTLISKKTQPKQSKQSKQAKQRSLRDGTRMKPATIKYTNGDKSAHAAAGAATKEVWRPQESYA